MVSERARLGSEGRLWDYTTVQLSDRVSTVSRCEKGWRVSLKCLFRGENGDKEVGHITSRDYLTVPPCFCGAAVQLGRVQVKSNIKVAKMMIVVV